MRKSNGDNIKISNIKSVLLYYSTFVIYIFSLSCLSPKIKLLKQDLAEERKKLLQYEKEIGKNLLTALYLQQIKELEDQLVLQLKQQFNFFEDVPIMPLTLFIKKPLYYNYLSKMKNFNLLLSNINAQILIIKQHDLLKKREEVLVNIHNMEFELYREKNELNLDY